jgi:RNA polymerase sigma-70 factor (ECF subfamily)
VVEGGGVHTHDQPSDEDLIVALLDGDARALAELYLRHGGMVVRFLTRTLGDASLAEDLCHDVFLALPDAAHNYRKVGKPRSWLLGIAANKARSYRRRQWLREKLLRAYCLLVPRRGDAVSARHDEPADRIAAALYRLPLEQRQVLMLQVGEGLSGTEIAEALSISHGAVRVRLHRARAALREAVLDRERAGGEP